VPGVLPFEAAIFVTSGSALGHVPAADFGLVDRDLDCAALSHFNPSYTLV
jgi:hypothetical protein